MRTHSPTNSQRTGFDFMNEVKRDAWDVPEQPFYYPLALDFQDLLRRFPPFDAYFSTVWSLSREELRALQEGRFRAQIDRAWSIDFYRRLWTEAGLTPDDRITLDDLSHLPTFSVYDLRKDLEEHPPFGSFQGVDPGDGNRIPLRLITSGGTTGVPRPMFYSAWDREIGTIIGSRVHYAHGIRPGMIVQIVNGLSTVNGGIYQMECVWKYCGATPLTTGGGNATPTEMQIKMAQSYGVDAIEGFPDYIRHIGNRAAEMGIDPSADLRIRFISTMLGRQDRRDLEDLFDAQVFDSYGTSEVGGYVSTECWERSGRHVMEDVYIMEIIDTSTGQPAHVGEPGSVVITSLFKWAAPMIRYNTNDLSTLLHGDCSCGSSMTLQGPILGRADDLVKVKGMWVHPEAVGEIVAADPRTTKEYVCILDRVRRGATEMDQMRVLVEKSSHEVNEETLIRDLEHRLRTQFGVSITVQCRDRDALDELTGRSNARSGKTRRLIKTSSD